MCTTMKNGLLLLFWGGEFWTLLGFLDDDGVSGDLSAAMSTAGNGNPPAIRTAIVWGCLRYATAMLLAIIAKIAD